MLTLNNRPNHSICHNWLVMLLGLLYGLIRNMYSYCGICKIYTIPKVTKNNTSMYTEESSQQTFKIQNNDLDVGFEGLTKTTKMKLYRPESRTR